MFNAKLSRIIFQTILLVSLAACSSMPAGNLPADQRPNASVQEERIAVKWIAESGNDLTAEERKDLENLMHEELSTLDLGSDLRVRAELRHVETVRPWLNWASTLLVVVPVDRGGVSVDFVVQEVSSGKTQVVPFAEWTPLTELRAQYSKLGPAKAGVRRAVAHLRKTLLDQAMTPTT